LIIKPKNVLLASVNFCLGCVGIIQLGRIFMHNRAVKKQSPGQQMEAAKDNIVATAEGVKDDVKATVSS
jgi:mitochondrial pyruvate carrier 2